MDIAQLTKIMSLNSEQVNDIQKYSSLMQKWNTKIQMTATRSPQEFFERHLLDAVHLATAIPEGPGRMIDVGSGGGLPGLVLAIARPEIEFTLIEPTNKKHAFLSTVRREVGLRNVRTRPIRDDQWVESEEFELMDYAVARAVWALDEWLERAQRLVRPGGRIYALEAKEKFDLPEGATRREYRLPGGRERAIVCLVKGEEGQAP